MFEMHLLYDMMWYAEFEQVLLFGKILRDVIFEKKRVLFVSGTIHLEICEASVLESLCVTFQDNFF